MRTINAQELQLITANFAMTQRLLVNERKIDKMMMYLYEL